MIKSNSSNNESGKNVRTDERLQEKLIERYFQQLDLNDVHVSPTDAEFDSKKVYNKILGAIEEEPVIVKRSYSKWLVAASFLAVFAMLSWYYRFTILNYVSPIHTLEVAAANGSVTNITLGDGTKIWLNGGSKLKYPETFRGELREIAIEGEAFFDVAHDADKPFIVHTGDISTHVLGTSFNIKAYADEHELKVDVASGKVGVAPSANSGLEFKTVFLSPAEGVIYDKNKRSIIKATNIDLSVISGWKENKLVFKNTPLNDVVSTLKRKFSYTINIDKNLTACNISADFTNVPLKDIMAVIARLVKGKATLNGNVYYIKGKGC
ncbi:MAG: FecR family protein [Sphingobacteriaceae bacterium]|nr:MAG: FecR family protein [Sphingobacteriaceae bacterium]